MIPYVWVTVKEKVEKLGRILKTDSADAALLRGCGGALYNLTEKSVRAVSVLHSAVKCDTIT